jgi:dihydrofolate reductase
MPIVTGTITLRMIVAMARNGGIGKSGTIPWHYSEDLKRFRTLTSGCPIIMGRNTWNSLPKQPLPKRLNIVLTRDPTRVMPICESVRVACSPEEAIQIAEHYYRTKSINEVIRTQHSSPNVWVIGGQAVYETFIHHPLLSHLDCTIVPENVECDTFFVPIPDRFTGLQIHKTVIPKGTLIHHEYSLSPDRA